ncbi:hypothetical protein COLO4_33815 [Corchorus olitorius]|uniref:Uncharacterized protein n=1 Tax=Corchorus olitorius TaxID=93759 RepID=A0A1R3GR68_9ROSI|nr:hypothetical protein COLO4_33815 [Corchorus olitorius]
MGQAAAVTFSAETLDTNTHSTVDQTQEIIRQVISCMSSNSMGCSRGNLSHNRLHCK